MKRKWLAVGIAVGVLVVASVVAHFALHTGQGGGHEQEATRHAGHSGTGHKIAKAQTICPVMGDKIDKSLYADHMGKRVYFCCKMCVGKFKDDPMKYIKKLEAEGVTLEKAPVGASGSGHKAMEHGGERKQMQHEGH